MSRFFAFKGEGTHESWRVAKAVYNRRVEVRLMILALQPIFKQQLQAHLKRTVWVEILLVSQTCHENSSRSVFVWHLSNGCQVLADYCRTVLFLLMLAVMLGETSRPPVPAHNQVGGQNNRTDFAHIDD